MVAYVISPICTSDKGFDFTFSMLIIGPSLSGYGKGLLSLSAVGLALRCIKSCKFPYLGLVDMYL